jgi:hypothetical protein
MVRAASFKDAHALTLFPGILLSATVKNLFALEQRQLQRFNSERWQSFDGLIDGCI